MRLTLLLPLIPLALALPSPAPASPRALFPRQAPSDSTSAGVANAIAALFSAFSGRVSNPSPPSTPSGGGSAPAGQVPPTPTPAVAPDGLDYASVAYLNCAAGSNVTGVRIAPCEGGSGAEGDPCVFTQGRNYTIVITYTSPLSVPVNQSRTGLASYDGDQRTAYSGQSFGACSYTQCPITQGVEKTYVYPFRTLALPNFQKFVFNATNGVAGESIMCARVPVTFQPAS